MKKSITFVILGILLGVAIFGFVKSVELWKKNLDLSRTAEVLNVKLAATQISLRETQKNLGERNAQKERLTEDVMVLESRLAKKIQEAEEYLKNNAKLSAKLAEAGKANSSLVQENKIMGEHLIRMAFENNEMKQKLSSIQKLKQAIKELKLRRRKKAGQARPAVVKKESAPQPQEGPGAVAESRGNKGFLIRDGKSTFLEFVDIRVTSVEPSSP